MKKLFTLLALMCMVCTGAWAQIVTSTPENPVPYGLKDISANSATAFVASDLTVKNSGDQYGLFIFIETGTTDYYKIYELKSQKYVHDKGDHEKGKSKTELVASESNATNWHIRLSETANRYLISPEGVDGIYWNFYQGFDACASETMGYYNNATDAGSKWFLVRTPFIGDPVTSLEDGGIYMPYCVGHSSYLEDQVGENDKRLYMTYDANFATNYTGNKLISFMWKMHASDGKWKMENLSSGRYIGNTNNRGDQNNSVDAASAGAFTVSTISGEQFSVKNDAYYWDANGKGNSSGTFTFWTQASGTISAGSNGAYKFYKLEGAEYCQLADVAFGSRITNENNFEFTTITRKQLVGFAANNDVTKLSFPYYTFTAATGETMVEAEGTKVYGTCTSALPFTPNTFYAVHFRDGITTAERNGFLCWNGSQAKCRDLTVEKATEETTWWFKRIEGTPYFSMHNLAKGADYGVTGGTTSAAITMTQEPSQLYPVANSTGTNGFQMVFSGTAYQLGDHSNGNLAIWADTRTSDQGSRMTIEDVTGTMTSSLKNTIENVKAKVGTLGYPRTATAFEGYTAIDFTNYFDAKAALATDDIVLPVVGKAYRIAFAKSTNGDKYYVPATGAPTEDVNSAAVFMAGKSKETNYPFAFIEVSNGNYLNYQGASSEAYANYTACKLSALAANTTSTGLSTKYPASTRLGYIYLETKCRPDNANKEGCMVMSEENNSWSGADDPFFNGNHTSALVFEEVEIPQTFTLLNRHGEGTNSGLDRLTVGTFSAAYNVALPSGVEAYTAVRDGDILYFENIGSVVPANKGVLLYAENFNENYTGEITYTDQDAPTVENNVLMPLLYNAAVNEGDYVLTNAYNGVGFYPRATATTASNKAYIPAGVGAGIRGFVFGNEDGLTTAISQLSAQNSKHAAFDLAGRRVNAAVKGISIVNGKKFIK